MKRILAAIILILAVNAGAADYLGTYAQYNYSVRNNLGIDSTAVGYLPSATIKGWVQDGLITLPPITRMYKIETYVITSRGQYVYSLDSTLVGISSVVWSKGDKVKSIVYVPREKWFEQRAQTSSGMADTFAMRPSFYDHTDNQAFLFPVPVITGDTIKISGWGKVPSIYADSTAPTRIPVQYRPTILAYATWKAARALRRQDATQFLAELNMNLFALGWRMNEEGVLSPVSPAPGK